MDADTSMPATPATKTPAVEADVATATTGIRHPVDLLLAKIEDAMTGLRNRRPLTPEEQARLHDLAGWLDDLAVDLKGR